MRDGNLPEATTEEAAKVLVEYLFAQTDHTIPGLSYAVGYNLAEGPTGGDIVDLYHFDNDAVAFAIADISGKGPRAAVNAALIKFGLRAYSSVGMTPERVIQAMDRLYLENNAFEKTESFASVFFGIVDPTRRLMTYSNAGHEPVLLIGPDGTPRVLPPTAPLIGVFDDQHHLFKQAFIEIEPGTVFVGATDGVTEARNGKGQFFGMDGLVETAVANRTLPEADLVQAIIQATWNFAKAADAMTLRSPPCDLCSGPSGEGLAAFCRRHLGRRWSEGPLRICHPSDTHDRRQAGRRFGLD